MSIVSRKDFLKKLSNYLINKCIQKSCYFSAAFFPFPLVGPSLLPGRPWKFSNENKTKSLAIPSEHFP
jgi:hypothetical protein